MAALEAAMSHASGVWSFPPPTERKLTAAVVASNNVIVLFSVSGGGAFQGCALFSGQTTTEGSRSGVRFLILNFAWKSFLGETRLDCCSTCIILEPSDSWSLKQLR